MPDYNSLKAAPTLFATAPASAPIAATDPDHMASTSANELANQAAVTVAETNPTNLPGPVNVGGLGVTPGKAAPQFMANERTGRPIPLKFTP